MTNFLDADSIGKTFDLDAPSPENGIPAHWQGYRVRILDPLLQGYCRCMMISPFGYDSHTALVHHKSIVRGEPREPSHD